MKSLRNRLNGIIKKQMRAQSGRSTGYENLPNELLNYGRITAETSAKGHLDRVKQFSKYMKEQYPKIKDPKDIKKEHIDKYIQYRINKGIAAKTIEADVLTMNHLFIPTGTLKEPLSKVQDYKIVARENEYKNNRQTTGKEWIQQHNLAYNRHKNAIDTLRAFGIRKTELTGRVIDKRIIKNGLTTNSFFRNEKGTLSIISVAKGGHIYISEVRNDLANEMEQLYGKYTNKKGHDANSYKIIKEMIRNKSSTNPIDERHTKVIKKELYKGEKLFDTNAVPSNIRAHIFRSEYAIEKLEEIKNKDDDSKQISMNGFMATINQFKEVSENLGHHRIKVLYKYLRK